MIKFAANIPPESVCTVFGVVKRTSEKVQSTAIQDFEVQATRIYIVSKAQVPLPLLPADSERPLPLEDKDPVKEVGQALPLVSLNTRLNNRVLDLRAKLNHCIFLLKDGVDCLFQEFLRSHGFIRIHTPKIMGAPTEGVFSAYKSDTTNSARWKQRVSPRLFPKECLLGSESAAGKADGCPESVPEGDGDWTSLQSRKVEYRSTFNW
jgi:aspartyl-tRNA synthetase